MSFFMQKHLFIKYFLHHGCNIIIIKIKNPPSHIKLYGGEIIKSNFYNLYKKKDGSIIREHPQIIKISMQAQ